MHCGLFQVRTNYYTKKKKGKQGNKMGFNTQYCNLAGSDFPIYHPKLLQLVHWQMQIDISNICWSNRSVIWLNWRARKVWLSSQSCFAWVDKEQKIKRKQWDLSVREEEGGTGTYKTNDQKDWRPEFGINSVFIISIDLQVLTRLLLHSTCFNKHFFKFLGLKNILKKTQNC